MDSRELAFDSENIVVCERDERGRVLWQNGACRKLCGERKNLVCADGCTGYLGLPREDRLKVVQNAVVHGVCADISGVTVRHHMISIVQLHERLYRDLFAGFRACGLTKSETKVMRMKLVGYSNQEIADALFISKSTVKTHVLHAFQKIPASLMAKLKDQVRAQPRSG